MHRLVWRIRLLALTLLVLTPSVFPPYGSTAFGEDGWPVDAWSAATLDFAGPSTPAIYVPLEAARRKWRLCASYPHLKDSYWLSVNYGMVEQARKSGVALRVVEAGGYPNLDRQIAQVKECTRGADALVLGTVSYDGLTPTVLEVAGHMPVIAAVNDIASNGITAKAGVSWTEMGRAIGEYFARLHPKGSAPAKVAWFPGPKGAGWVTFVEAGFRPAMANSSADIVAVKWGDTGLEPQLLLIEDVLEAHPDVDYIIGSAVTADAAVSVLRVKGLQGRIKVLADYFIHGTYRAIKRRKVLAAPTDYPVMQGRIAIDQAIRAIEGSLTFRHAGPRILIVDDAGVDALKIDESLAPAWFKPTFEVP
jgi:protein TorT